MKGETILNALKEQVIHFSIENSLFDIVVVSFARFLLLITFYGVFAINHWIIIAVSLVCFKILQKIFIFFLLLKFSAHHNHFMCIPNTKSFILQCKYIILAKQNSVVNIEQILCLCFFFFMFSGFPFHNPFFKCL